MRNVGYNAKKLDMKIDEDDLKNSIDFLMSCELSIDFLQKFSVNNALPVAENMTIRQFYNEWSKSTSDFSQTLKIPFNAGIILGYLMVGIVYTKENWFDLLPNKSLEEIDEDWGFKNKIPLCPKLNKKPDLKYTIRRIRNSLSHRNVRFCPLDMTKVNMFNVSQFLEMEFYDENPQDKTDTFDIKLNFNDLNKFIIKFRNEIYRTFINKNAL